MAVGAITREDATLAKAAHAELKPFYLLTRCADGKPQLFPCIGVLHFVSPVQRLRWVCGEVAPQRLQAVGGVCGVPSPAAKAGLIESMASNHHQADDDIVPQPQ